ncbi:MAG TPA: hypothetical protein VFD84_02700 [Candidatus Binatia bacterium]|nr:hypothetical protein [Candidatus Binatia bacterium]
MAAVKANLVVGRPAVSPSWPAHTKGVREGNARGAYGWEKGHLKDGRSTARRSTGINWRRRNPIDPKMPNLSPP